MMPAKLPISTIWPHGSLSVTQPSHRYLHILYFKPKYHFRNWWRLGWHQTVLFKNKQTFLYDTIKLCVDTCFTPKLLVWLSGSDSAISSNIASSSRYYKLQCTINLLNVTNFNLYKILKPKLHLSFNI